jgi:hypothetical protein
MSSIRKVNPLIYLVLCLWIIQNNGVFSQSSTFDGEEILPPQMNGGDLLIGGFASYPNWELFILNLVNEYDSNPNYTDVKLGGLAPVGIKLEYLFTPMIGMTLEGMYNFWNVDFNTNEFENSFGVQRTRIQIGFNYHVTDINVEKLDVYGGLAIGTNSRLLKSESTDPNFSISGYYPGWNRSFPISFRFRGGLSYFFTEKVALNMEVGVGGPIISAGIIYRSPARVKEEPEVSPKY